MQLISEILVETKFNNKVNLYNNRRKQTIRVFSSSDFKVEFNYGGQPEDHGQLVLH